MSVSFRETLVTNNRNCNSKLLKSGVHNLFGTRDQFCGRQFFHGLGRGNGSGGNVSDGSGGNMTD